MFRTAAVAALLLAALALTAGAQKDTGEKKGNRYQTPQEVCNAAHEAEVKKDYKTMVPCSAPETQKEFAVFFALLGVEDRREFNNEKDEKKRAERAKEMKAVGKVLDNHGLTEKATKDVNFGQTIKERQ